MLNAYECIIHGFNVWITHYSRTTLMHGTQIFIHGVHACNLHYSRRTLMKHPLVTHCIIKWNIHQSNTTLMYGTNINKGQGEQGCFGLSFCTSTWKIRGREGAVSQQCTLNQDQNISAVSLGLRALYNMKQISARYTI